MLCGQICQVVYTLKDPKATAIQRTNGHAAKTTMQFHFVRKIFAYPFAQKENKEFHVLGLTQSRLSFLEMCAVPKAQHF